MSTRCNVRFTQKDLGWQEDVQLYRHCDGYPTSILPDLAQAFAGNHGWEAGRAGKSAAILIKSSEGCYEPENNLIAHGDIDYLYTVQCENNPLAWKVRVEVPAPFGSGSFREILAFTDVAKAAELAESLETANA